MTTTADSGVFRLASVGSYLDALSSITDEMSVSDRTNLIFLDKGLHTIWGLGENVIMANNASLAGHVTVGDYAILSGYSLIHQFCTVGDCG